MSEELGASPSLDENFDFIIGATGDIQCSFGVDELQKDIAVNLKSELQSYIGKPPSPNVRSDIIRDAGLVALADERIINVYQEEASVTFDKRETISLRLPVQTTSGEEYTLVFNI